MSFILDALKKSENERQRQVGPSLADVQVRQRRNDKPWWVVAVAALLVLNLGVLLVVLMRDGDAKSSAPQAAPANAPAAATAAATDSSVAGTQVPLPASASRMPRGNPPVAAATNPAVHSLADEAGGYEPGVVPEADPQLSAAAAVPEGPPLVRPIEAPAVAPAAVQPPPQAQPAQDQEMLPTSTSLMASGTALPDMHLDIHVYAPKPADRFVFVNMRKYTEGQALKEGPTVERITPEGAILNQHGLRFLLPRQ